MIIKKKHLLSLLYILFSQSYAMENKLNNSISAPNKQICNKINLNNSSFDNTNHFNKTIPSAAIAFQFPQNKTESEYTASLYADAKKRNDLSSLPPIDSIRNTYGQTLLIFAAMIGDHYSVENLLKCDAKVNTKDPFNSTALNWAASSGVLTPKHLLTFPSEEKAMNAFTLCAEKVINAGADLNNYCYKEENGIKTKNMTPIHSACVSGNEQLIKLIFKKAKSKNILKDVVAAKGYNKRTAIHFTIRFCEGAMQKTLSQHEAAVIESIVHVLIKNGCSKEETDIFDKTPYYYANHSKMPNTLCNVLYSYKFLDNARKNSNKNKITKKY